MRLDDLLEFFHSTHLPLQAPSVLFLRMKLKLLCVHARHPVRVRSSEEDEDKIPLKVVLQIGESSRRAHPKQQVEQVYSCQVTFTKLKAVVRGK